MSPQTSRPVRGHHAARAVLLAAGGCLAVTAPAIAGPEGEQVVRGDVGFERSGATTTITASDGAIINYSSFDIARPETVQFIQPGADARVLNRVQSTTPTTIDGALIANGQVYIVNPAGVVFGENSIVNAAGFFAVAGDIADSDFISGNLRFNNVTGEVVNRGLLTAGAVHLIGRRIANHGTIVADDGLVSMIVGGDLLVRHKGSTVAVRVDAPAAASAVSPASHEIENTGEVRASGGIISLGAGDAVSLAVHGAGRFDVGAGGSVALVSPGDLDVSAMGVEIVAGTTTLDAAGSVFFPEDVNKVNGGLVVNAGQDIVFGADAMTGDLGLTELTLRADSLSLNAGRTFVDNVALGTRLESITGDIALTASNGSVAYGAVAVAPNQTLRITQSQELVFTTGSIVSPATTNVEIDVLAAPLTLGGGFGGVTSLDPLLSLSARSLLDLRVESGVVTTNTASIESLVGRVVFGSESFFPIPAARTERIDIAASDLSIVANNELSDFTNSGVFLEATSGDIALTSRFRDVEFTQATVANGRTVSISQAFDMFFFADVLGNKENTNVVLDVTDGSISLLSGFGGDPSAQQALSMLATASDNVTVNDALVYGDFATLRAGDDVTVLASLAAPNALTLNAGRDGTGSVAFGPGGVTLASALIDLIGGSASPGGSATVDALTNAPTFLGAAGAGTSPDDFRFRQDIAVNNLLLPAAGQFGAGAAGVAYRAESFDAGVTIADGSSLTGSALTLASGSASGNDPAARSVINDQLDLLSLTVLGAARLNDNVVASASQNYDGPVELGTDVVLNAADVSFAGPVDSATGTPRALRVIADTLLQGDVGSAAPLASLTIDGTAGFGAATPVAVTTVGDQTYAGPALLNANTSLVAGDAGVIAFGSTLDGGFDLGVVTGDAGLITFGGDVGVNERLGTLSLSTAGADGVRGLPDAATIVAEPAGDQQTIAFLTDRFVMGELEKLTAFVGLTIDATADAVLGDLVTTGDLSVTAPVISLLRRQPGELITRTGSTVLDQGLDFVAGGEIDFNGAIVLAGDPDGGDPVFGTPTGIGTGLGAGDGNLVFVSSSLTTADALRLASGDDAGRALDQRALFFPPVVPGDALVNPVPDGLDGGDDPEFPEFADSTTPRLVSLGQLARLPVDARLPDTGEATDLTSRTVFLDTPPVADGDVTLVAAKRLPRAGVSTLAARYDALFGSAEDDRTGVVAAAVSAAVSGYMGIEDAGAFEPDGFVDFLLASPDHAEAAAYALALGGILDDLRTVGLNEREFRQARDRLMAELIDQDAIDAGVRPADIAAACELIAAADVPAAPDDPADAPAEARRPGRQGPAGA